jgi:Uma2 family endonuclease
MATVGTAVMTADEFWEWIHRPENADRRWELDRGEVIEMPSPGEHHGALCAWVAHLLWSHVLQQLKGGYVTSNDTGLLVEQGPDSVRGPDVMVFGPLGLLERVSLRYSTRIPRLVVEVLSPNDRPNQVNRRIAEYLRRGVPLVWVVDFQDRTVGVHRPNEIQKVFDDTEELSGEDALPGLKLRVAQLLDFPGREAAAVPG